MPLITETTEFVTSKFQMRQGASEVAFCADPNRLSVSYRFDGGFAARFYDRAQMIELRDYLDAAIAQGMPAE